MTGRDRPEVWLNAGFVDPTELAALAAAAERLGYAGIDLPDHLFFPDRIDSPYPYSDDGSVLWPAATPWADPWVAIAAMANATERLRFATGVQIAPLRDPFTLAKAVATAQVMSHGRVLCGFGVGWLSEEFDVVGVDFASRGRRMDEMLTVLALLWTGEVVSHDGEFFAFDRIMMRPAAPGTPILIGGNSVPALRRAARHDGWIGTHRSIEATRALLDDLQAALATDGRSLDGFRVAVTGPDLVGEDPDVLADLGVDAITLPMVALGRARSLDERVELLARTADRLGLG